MIGNVRFSERVLTTINLPVMVQIVLNVLMLSAPLSGHYPSLRSCILSLDTSEICTHAWCEAPQHQQYECLSVGANTQL